MKPAFLIAAVALAAGAPAFAQTPADCETEPENVFERKLEAETVQSILQLCSLNHRETLVLRYYQNLSLEEIAETLECTAAAAKVRLHRARKVFKDHYISQFGSDALCVAKEGE